MIAEMPAQIKQTWLRFVEEIEPLRSDLFRYSLRLTGNPFDAEDLVHDGMLKAFSSMALQEQKLTSPRGFLLKAISNLWIDSVRRSQLCLLDMETESVLHPETVCADDLRSAVSILITQLNPKEQVITVLSEVFEMTHKEISKLLSTTEGTIKVAAHRSRNKLKRSVLPNRAPKELVEKFVEVFLTHDLDAVKSLLMSEFEAEVFPNGIIVGREYNAKEGWLNGCFYLHIAEREAAKDPYPQILEVREIGGEHVILVFRNGREEMALEELALEEVWRFEADVGELARVRDYGFSPDLVRWVADHFGTPFRQVGYQFRENIY